MTAVIPAVIVSTTKPKKVNEQMKHMCHWPGCPTPVPPAMWGCKKHWFMLPKKLRDYIWETYVPGQEITKTPSLAYLDAARQVQTWISAWEFAQKKMTELAAANKVKDEFSDKGEL